MDILGDGRPYGAPVKHKFNLIISYNVKDCIKEKNGSIQNK